MLIPFTKLLEIIILLKRFIDIFKQYKQLLNNKNLQF